jgi:hypothetical protein
MLTDWDKVRLVEGVAKNYERLFDTAVKVIELQGRTIQALAEALAQKGGGNVAFKSESVGGEGGEPEGVRPGVARGAD